MSKAVLIRAVPEDIHHRFKVLCAIEGKSLERKIVELMEQASSGTVIKTVGKEGRR